MDFKDSFAAFSRKAKETAGKAADGVKNGFDSLRDSVKGLSGGSGSARNYRGASSAGGRRGGKAARPIWLSVLLTMGKYLARTFATFVLIGIITSCIVAAAAMVYVLTMPKSVDEIDLAWLKLNYTTKIFAYDSEGNQFEYESLHGNENREWVDEQDISDYAKKAAIAVEDERFLKHHGVDWKSTAGAFANMFLGIYKTERGGSTITQQLIKNVTKDDAHSVNRKLTEIFKALELEKKYTKSQILEAYLNVIALGSGCNGIQTAAQTYFGKDAKDLTLAESAAIVGITKYPSKYNPLYHPEENQKRQRYVLKKMYENGLISTEEYEAAKAEDYISHLNTASLNRNTTIKYWSWYTEQIYTDIVNDLQKRNGMTEADARFQLYNGGFKIYANVDVDLQKKAEAIFKNKSGNNTDYWVKFPRSVQPQCAIAILNYDGEIKAIVGARGEKNANRLQNHASQSRRQPGSAIKPLSAYGLAVNLNAIEFSTPVTDQPMTIRDEGRNRTWPRNDGGRYRGNIPVVKGLEVSANCVAARIVRYITPQASYKFLTERLSIRLNEKDNNLAPMSVGALTDGVTVLEMASAYVIFGSGGIYYSPASYSLVTDQ
ncbi:MAG: penicillin-binding protein, partial [Clostridia bacterium]|nr:penicillin-binding protein [Clostridia bacterium]